jgi:GT2 family glycosyltransferase
MNPKPANIGTFSANSQPNVWIVLLNFNGWRDTLQCLAHLEKLNYASYSIVVVDNGSTDSSIAEIRRRYPSMHILDTGENLGFGAGNNIAIRFAYDRGADFIWLLNNDTLPPAGSLTEMIRAAFNSPCRRVLVGSTLAFADDPATIQAWGGGRIHALRGVTRHLTSPGKLDYITAASLLAPRFLFEEVGLFDENYFLYWEDADLCQRARRAGWRFAVAGGEPILHKHSASTKKQVLHTPSFSDFYFVRGMVRFFLKQGSLSGILGIAVRLGGMSINRLRRGHGTNLRAIGNAAIQALRQPTAPRNAGLQTPRSKG